MSPLRLIVIVIAGLETALWLLALYATLSTNSDAAGNGLAQAYAMFATIAWGVTAAPALLLGISGRALRLALVLALLLAAAIIWLLTTQYGFI